MRRTERLSVSSEEGAPPRLELDGRPTEARAPGIILEAAFEAEEGLLAFFTHDSPFDESLEIVLLDHSLRTVDRLAVPSHGVLALFSDPEPRGPRALAFRYFGGEPWMVEVSERPRWRLPFTLPPGVEAPLGPGKRLTLLQP